MDRFDLRVAVHRPEVEEILNAQPAESSALVAQRVLQVRQITEARSGGTNAELAGAALEEHAPLSDAARAMLRSELERNRLTGRGLHRIRRVARTIADLEGDPDQVIAEIHVAEALSMRAQVHAHMPEIA
jgi:magnesium chelatase family protein